MIQCKDCEFFEEGPAGEKIFKCDPFANIKEPECISKWQLMRLDLLLSSYRMMMSSQQRMGPVQDKIMKYVERELKDLDDADSWKADDNDDDFGPIM
ncbi:MAG: hypothetical protein KAS23_11890 [Anaerohalosphaera sp.]|nr:hypothetical protein [Anaerohalosphaera sp.]